MISNYEFVFRIVISALCGSAIGYERTNRNKGAGIRTHAIVALASALMMIISKYSFSDVGNYDASSVGFLGAGLIFVRNNSIISGLTTAAGIWGTSGVGMAIGSGQYFIGIFSTLLIVSIQIYFHKNNFFTKGEGYRYKLYLKIINMDSYSKIKGTIVKSMQIEALSIKKHMDTTVDIEIDILIKDSYKRFEVLEELMKSEYVIDGYWE